MAKIHGVLERIIDVFAVTIVIESFLRFVGISHFRAGDAEIVDVILIVILALDLLYRYSLETKKRRFIRESWPEFFALIPFLPGMRLFRLFRVIRKSRLRSFFAMLKDLLTEHSLHYVLGVVLLLSFIGGGLIYRAEGLAQGMTIADGIWFSLVTMTTVGYGDFYPVTASGRIIAFILMIIGMGFLGILTGNIASFFVKRVGHKGKKKEVDLSVDTSGLSKEDIIKVNDYIAFIKHKNS